MYSTQNCSHARLRSQVNVCMRSRNWHEQALSKEMGHFKETVLQVAARGAASPEKDCEPRKDCARCCSNGEANAWARHAPWRPTGLILHTVNSPLRGFKWPHLQVCMKPIIWHRDSWLQRERGEILGISAAGTSRRTPLRVHAAARKVSARLSRGGSCREFSPAVSVWEFP